MAAPATDIIDLRLVTRKILRRWWWFAISCGIAGALGVAHLKTTPKTFMVSARMLMGEGNRGFGAPKEDFLKGMSLVRGSSQLEDDIALLTSRSMVVKALNRLDFGVSYHTTHRFLTQEHYIFPPFRVALDSVSVQVAGVPIHVRVDRAAGTYRVTAEASNVRLYNVQKQEFLQEFVAEYKLDQTARIGEPFVGEHLSFHIEFPDDRQYRGDVDYFFQINSLDGLVMNYGSRLGVSEPEDNGHVISLSMAGSTPEKDIAYINTLMQAFIEAALHKQQQKGWRTIAFIDEQLGVVGDSLKRAEVAVTGTRNTTGLNPAGAADALAQERSRLENERSLVQRRRTYCVSVLDKIRSQSDMRNVPPPSSSGIDDPVLNNLVLEITKLSADIAARSVVAGTKDDPTTIAMGRRLKNLTSSLEQTAASLVERTEIDYDELSRRINGISFQLGQIPREEMELGIKQRQLNLSEGIYTYLQEKKAEAGIAIASDQVDKEVVDEARMALGGAIGPDKKTILGGALFIGLLLPALLIVLLDFFNDRIGSLDELKRATALPVLAQIPASKRKRVMPNEPKSLLAESFRTARINLQYLNANAPRQVIGFTSSTSGEGKTFCAVNLATVMALSGKRVLLIDADMRRPNVARTLELPDGPGLSTWLIGEAVHTDVIVPSDVPGLDVITAGPIPPNPGELAESPRMAELMREMRARYDHIIVDSSPLGLVSEFVVLMGHLDITLYVVRERFTRRGALRAVNEMAASGKVGRVDLLLNDMKAEKGNGYGYYTK